MKIRWPVRGSSPAVRILLAAVLAITFVAFTSSGSLVAPARAEF